MKKRIEVTAADIKKANRGRDDGSYDALTECLVATTLKRYFPRKLVEVATYTGTIGGKNITLPEKVAGKINAWMAGAKIRPFVFTLEI